MERLEFVLAEMCFSGPMGHLPMIVMEVSKEGQIRRANNYAKNILGRKFLYDSNDISTFLISPSSFDQIKSQIEAQEEMAGMDIKFRTEDGYRTAIWIAGSKRQETGSSPYYLLILYDLTEKIKFQDIIIQSRDKLRMVFDALDDLVLGIDRHGKIITANMAVARWKARDIRSIIGMTCQDIVGPFCARSAAMNSPNLCPITKVLNTHKTYLFRQSLKDLNGKEQWFMGKANPVFDKYGDIVQIALQFSPNREAGRS